MAKHSDNMGSVTVGGDVLPKGWYHFRVDKVEDGLVSKNSGAPMCKVILKVQAPDDLAGRAVTLFPSLQPNALMQLKGLYKATGYEPGPDGHDPEELNGREFFGKVDHEVYQGEARAKIAPYNMKPLTETPSVLGPSEA